MTAQPTEPVDISRLLGVVADYADQVATADELADLDSMQTAAALEALYVEGSWVAEWLEQKPRSERASNRFRADSRNRFSQWVAWRLEQENRRPLLNRHTYQLLNAAEVASQIPNLRQAQIRNERKIRALSWLLKNDHRDRVPEVWGIALTILIEAGCLSPDALTG